MTNNPLLVGSFFIALGSTIQCLRWVWVEGGKLQKRRNEASLRSEKVQIEREGRAGLDILGWVLVAGGAWYVFIGS